MKNFKRIISLAIAISMAMSLSGCVVYKNKWFGELTADEKKEAYQGFQQALSDITDDIADDRDMSSFIKKSVLEKLDDITNEFAIDKTELETDIAKSVEKAVASAIDNVMQEEFSKDETVEKSDADISRTIEGAVLDILDTVQYGIDRAIQSKFD